MKLRLDLLNVMTADDVLKEARRNQHRYSAEPVFSATGAGSLVPTSTGDFAKETERSATFVRKLKRRAKKLGRQLVSEPMPPEELGKLARRLAGNKNRDESVRLAAKITKGFYAGS